MEKNDKKNLPFKRIKKGNELSFNPFDVGKLPPQAPDLEEAVIGAVMLEKGALDVIIEFMFPDVFYVDAHSRIFAAILEMHRDRQAIDILTVTNKLKSKGELEIIGGAYYISKLTNRVASSANIEFHARMVFQKYMQRKLIQISTLVIRQSFEDSEDVFDTIEMLEAELYELNTSANTGSQLVQIKDVWNEIRERNEVLLTNKGVSGVPTGHVEVDHVTGGWQPTDLIILAARPGMGKTAFVLNAARQASTNQNKKIALFSLEMSVVQLCTRLASQESETELYKLNKKGIQPEDFVLIEDRLSKLFNAPFYIDDTPGLSISQFRAKAKKAVRELGIEEIIIDYLQLMTAGKDFRGNREQEVSFISRQLKIIAKELRIPIIVLSQLNRLAETRKDKRPQLGDLRESGAIEQDADVVMFIHRPEYFGENEYAGGISTEGLAELIFAKHRNGDLTTIKLRFNKRLTKFSDWSDDGDFTSSKTLEQHNLRNFSEPLEPDDLPF